MRNKMDNQPESIGLFYGLWLYLLGGVEISQRATRNLRIWLRFTIGLHWSIQPTAVMIYLISALTYGMVPVMTIWLSRWLVDTLNAIHSTGIENGFMQAALFAGAIGGMLIVGHLMSILNQFSFTRLFEHGRVEILRRVLKRAERVELIYFEQPVVHDFIARARSSSDYVVGFWMNLSRFITHFVSLFSVIVLITTYMPTLGILAFFCLIPTLLLRMSEVSSVNNLFFKRTEETRRLDYLSALLSGRQAAKEIRLFGLSEYLLLWWDRLFGELVMERFALQGHHLKVGILLTVVQRLFIFGLIAAAAGLLVNGELTLGSLVALLMALSQYFSAQRIVADSLYWALESGERVQHVIDFLHCDDFELLANCKRNIEIGSDENDKETKQTNERVNNRRSKNLAGIPQSCRISIRQKPALFPTPLRKGIFVRNLQFVYPHMRESAICGLDIDIPAGASVALVGENGCGKTTLAKLLCGLYPPKAGDIKYDETSIYDIDRKDLYSHFGAVFQDFEKYELPAREAIGIGKVDSMCDLVRIRQAAVHAGIDNAISRLKHGYETPLGKIFDQGTDLSSGEWQRVAIARAFMPNPQVLILDEPTAALDPVAEASLYQQFKRTAGGRTTLLISHRLGATTFADRIYLMAGGKVVECGTHEELISLRKRYWGMYEAQAEWYQ